MAAIGTKKKAASFQFPPADDEIGSLFERFETEKNRVIEKLKEKKARLLEQRVELTRAIDGQIAEVERALEKMGASGTSRVIKSSGGRVRRSSEQLAADARSIIALLESHKNGLTGEQIRKELPHVNYGQSLIEFVEKFAGKKLRSEGERRGMKYTV